MYLSTEKQKKHRILKIKSDHLVLGRERFKLW